MPRLPRVVVPGCPHHIIQRGNRRQAVFFNDQDKEVYLEFLTTHARKAGIEIWAYCLMDNHVHFVVIPHDKTSFARGIGETHKEYTRMIHFREGWRGYLWQGRFLSFPLDEQYLCAVVRYVERNPVSAGIVQRAEDYRWSSARAHVFKTKDSLLSDNFLIKEIADWAGYLEAENNKDRNIIIQHTSTGRPLGDEIFIARVEQITGRILRKKKPGPKGKGHKELNKKDLFDV